MHSCTKFSIMVSGCYYRYTKFVFSIAVRVLSRTDGHGYKIEKITQCTVWFVIIT
jgi:hypothetical protein